jgi:hypothetical protein
MWGLNHLKTTHANSQRKALLMIFLGLLLFIARQVFDLCLTRLNARRRPLQPLPCRAPAVLTRAPH